VCLSFPESYKRKGGDSDAGMFTQRRKHATDAKRHRRLQSLHHNARASMEPPRLIVGNRRSLPTMIERLAT